MSKNQKANKEKIQITESQVQEQLKVARSEALDKVLDILANAPMGEWGVNDCIREIRALSTKPREEGGE